ncbi:MAG TPA: CpsD/CapB family tyrosine-protein kinase [Bryobacteraceae bacterium]|nr:CpsD/CapB family tyrosine-protein kinase [Bryobacteraceae bacterium]
MSKIFDALKKADHLREAGVVEPALDEAPAAPSRSSAETATAVVEEAPVLPAESGPVEEPQPEQVRSERPSNLVSLRISALSPVFPFEDVHSRAAEQYRIVRTKIMHHPMQPRSIVVSSATSGDGKTVTAINLAAVLALKQDFQILLIDADLRRRDVSQVLGIPEKPGLANVLKGECGLDDTLLQLEQFPNLWILPAGVADRNPGELLASPRWRDVVMECKHRFNYMIVDATPMAAVADFDLIQVACDGVILVVRPDHTDRKTCMKALETMPKDKLIGSVLNCVEDWFLYKGQSYGYYKG